MFSTRPHLWRRDRPRGRIQTGLPPSEPRDRDSSVGSWVIYPVARRQTIKAPSSTCFQCFNARRGARSGSSSARWWTRQATAGTDAAARRLRHRAAAEAADNERKIAEWRGRPVMPGHTIQLRHVRSGRFVSLAAHAFAALDPSCFLVELAEAGSTQCWLQIEPTSETQELKPLEPGAKIKLLAKEPTELSACHPRSSASRVGCVKVHHVMSSLAPRFGGQFYQVVKQRVVLSPRREPRARDARTAQPAFNAQHGEPAASRRLLLYSARLEPRPSPRCTRGVPWRRCRFGRSASRAASHRRAKGFDCGRRRMALRRAEAMPTWGLSTSSALPPPLAVSRSTHSGSVWQLQPALTVGMIPST